MMIINIPNSITFVRLIILPFLIFKIIDGNFFSSFILFLIGSLTDFLDGFFARVLNQKTKFGTYFDPVVDKIFLLTTILILTYKEYLPTFFALIILFRDILVLIGTIILLIKRKINELKPNYSGKILIALEFLLVLSFFAGKTYDLKRFFALTNLLIPLTTTFAIISLFFYTKEFFTKKGAY